MVDLPKQLQQEMQEGRKNPSRIHPSRCSGRRTGPVLLSHLFSQGANAQYIQCFKVSYIKKRFLLPDVLLGERGRPWLFVFREVRLRDFFSSAATARGSLCLGLTGSFMHLSTN